MPSRSRRSNSATHHPLSPSSCLAPAKVSSGGLAASRTTHRSMSALAADNPLADSVNIFTDASGIDLGIYPGTSPTPALGRSCLFQLNFKSPLPITPTSLRHQAPPRFEVAAILLAMLSFQALCSVSNIHIHSDNSGTVGILSNSYFQTLRRLLFVLMGPTLGVVVPLLCVRVGSTPARSLTAHEVLSPLCSYLLASHTQSPAVFACTSLHASRLVGSTTAVLGGATETQLLAFGRWRGHLSPYMPRLTPPTPISFRVMSTPPSSGIGPCSSLKPPPDRLHSGFPVLRPNLPFEPHQPVYVISIGHPWPRQPSWVPYARTWPRPTLSRRRPPLAQRSMASARGATAAVLGGATEAQTQALGRWRGNTVTVYVTTSLSSQALAA